MCVLALCCGTNFRFGNNFIKKINEIRKKYNIKLTKLSLKYTFKQKRKYKKRAF